MKEGWEYIAFKDVYPIKMGKTPPRGDKSSWDEKKETHNKWVSIADISNNEGKTIEDTKEYISDSAAEKIYKVSKGSLMMSFKLSIGRMAFAGDDLYTNEAIIAIPKNDKYILRFIYFYLLSYDWLSLTEGNEKVKGATLNKSSIGKIQLPILSLSEQQSIVDYLDVAFAKIDAMKANAEKALNEAKALFQASLKEMLEPKEGWEEMKFGKICEFVRGPFGGSLKKECFRDSGYAVYEQQNAIYNKFTFRYFIDDEKYKSLIRFKVNPGDLIMSCSGTIGKVAIIPEDCEEGVINQALLKLTPKNKIDAHFLKYLMESNYFGEIINANIEGVAIKNIASVAVLKEIILSIPTVSVQQSIVATLDSLKSKVDRLQENYEKISQECDSLKQAILRQVFE